MNQSPSEQAKNLLKVIEGTHKVEVIGDEKFLERDVIHVKATPNEDVSNLFGEQEFWIDKETWVVLKMTNKVDDTTVTTKYTTFEIEPTFEKDQFVFEMPEGAEVVDFSQLGEEVILVQDEEAKQYLDKPFLYVEEQGELVLNNIEVFEMEEIPTQLTFNYLKSNIPYFSLTVMPVEEENKPYNNEGLNVRGQTATLDEFGDFRSISWVQDGIGYSVLIDAADVTTEEVLELIEAM